MPTPPDGFLTRPEAAKLYRRSRRALERDLDRALVMADPDVLSHWCLVTKDGALRPAAEVVTDEVKKLVTDGMTPAWCIEASWLEQEFGRKESSRRPRPREFKNSTPQSDIEPEESGPAVQVESSMHSRLLDEIATLKERLHNLDLEKRHESERSEKREQKLFEQLAVKDKQISSWDEITQGLARGLATGQLVPSLTSSQYQPSASNPDSSTTDSDTTQVASVVQPKHRASAKKKTSAKTSKPKPSVARTSKSKTAPKPTSTGKAKPKAVKSKSVAKKRAPMIQRFASGFLRRL